MLGRFTHSVLSVSLGGLNHYFLSFLGVCFLSFYGDHGCENAAV